MTGQMAVQLHASPSKGATAGDPQGPGFADSLYPLDAFERNQGAETCRFQRNKIGVDRQLFDSASSVVWKSWGEHGDLPFCAAAFAGTPGTVSENQDEKSNTSAPEGSRTHSQSSHGHLYAENSRKGDDSRARMTRKALRALLTDLQQIPTIVGESCTLCPVESAVHSCFRGVLSSGIKEEKFLSWVQSEPLILLWLPTCYRLSASETVTHPVRCSVCRAFPIIGLRYRCLKCLNFDVCQLCFVSDLHSKSHQKSHTVIEDHVQMSAKEHTKLLLRNLRNSLEPAKTGAVGKQWLLDQLVPRDGARHSKARICLLPPLMKCWELRGHLSLAKSIIISAKRNYVALTGDIYLCQRLLPAPRGNDNPHHQAIVTIKKDLWRTRDSINALHRERRLLRKQLNRYKHKLQGTYALQKKQNCRFETKIRELAVNQNNLWTKLQRMRQDLQVMLQTPHPASASHSMASKTDYSLPCDGLWRGDSSSTQSATRYGPGWKLLPEYANTDRNHKRQTSSGKALPDSENPEIILQSTRTQSNPQKMLREVHTSSSACQEGLQDSPQIPPAEVSSPAVAPSAEKEIDHQTSEMRNVLEEEELQTLLPRLLDAFDLDTPSGLQPSVDMELYGRAEQLRRAFSALVDQITLTSLE
ncbi:dystrotelin [Sigmodon hispidus]